MCRLSYIEERVASGGVFDLVTEYDTAVNMLAPSDELHEILTVLSAALRRHTAFLAKHPSSAFQCFWNACWWHDCAVFQEYDPRALGSLRAAARKEQPAPGSLSQLMELWRSEWESRSRVQPWIRSCHPPLLSLNNGLRVMIPLGSELDSLHELELSDRELTVWFARYQKPGELVSSGAKVWDVSTGELLRETQPDEYASPDPARSPDGSLIANIEPREDEGGWGAPVTVSDATSGAKVSIFPVDEDHNLWTVRFSPDGARLAAFGYGIDSEGEVYVWDVRSGSLVANLMPSTWATALAFSPVKNEIATGSSNGEVQIWNLQSGQVHQSLPGHEGSVTGVAFSPDGRWLASTAEDGTARIWDLGVTNESGFTYHPDSIVEVVYSPNGKRLVTRSENGTTWLWDGDSGRPVKCLHQSDMVLIMGGDARKCLFVDNETVISRARDGGAWNLSDGRRIDGVEAPDESGITMSKNGRHREDLPEPRWLARRQRDELCIADKETGVELAWLQLFGKVSLTDHPSGKAWAATVRGNVCQLVLEGV